MKETITTYEAAVWGFISTLGVTCVVGGGLTKLLNDKIRSSIVSKNNFINSSTPASAIGPLQLRYGLQIYMSMPCTISSRAVIVIPSFLFFICFFLETVFRRCSVREVFLNI